ncbi:pro-sigmaK processing inhibitor BofA family protein [Harryflintia acetispora]|uniref:SigmaK-factor processing regulatory protein BofA n=1 Tax=Harryflintia acetispora TaxID=1849041 RepID=A0A9X8Y7N6_9FIRM|nr:pro-sigmaK processing inhibitor BofA family protein [Harryflintia acetispora]TCL42598.1 sigmaK-factor processing regulatory protein BofA [Harryflintia acetispora]
MLDTIYLGGFLLVSAIVMLTALIRQRILVRGLLLSAVSGLGSLGVVSLLSGTFSLGVTFNLFSAITSVLYGVPGVIGILVLHMITG